MSRAVHPRTEAGSRFNYRTASTLFWIAAIVALSLWVAGRLGAFDLWATVQTAESGAVNVANGFALVDHPFHAVRAETLRRALADSHFLRWVGHHQGGYPVEFYPLGVAGLEVAVWAFFLGALPMIAVHKLTVIAVFLAPVAGFLLLSRRTRGGLGVAALALAAHVAVRGWWWSGGSMELVEWGLVTNVAAATALIIALPLLADWTEQGNPRVGAVASLAIGFALLTNPRSAFAIAAMGAGLVVAALTARSSRLAVSNLARRLAAVGLLSALIAAPELLALARFEHLYYFVLYSGYADLRAYLDSSIQAVSAPFFWLGLAGTAVGARRASPFAVRVAAFTLASYVALTAFLVRGAWPASTIEQLETTRLMPFQRLLWLFLAAFAVGEVVAMALRAVDGVGRRTAFRDALMAGAAVLVILAYVVLPVSWVPESDRGLVSVPTSAQPGIVDLEAAVRMADQAAEPGTALLVLGTTVSWHDQLWSPLWSDRPFFYDDWLWYWQTEHVGDYDPTAEHAYRSDASTLDRAYLDAHGIGAVIVTGEAKDEALNAPELERVRSGIYDVFTVENPTVIVTVNGNEPAGVSIAGQQIEASGVTSGSEVLVRRNWFPRWRATVDGQSVPVVHRPDGYMTVSAPADGEGRLELVYAVDRLDWFGRILTVIGLVMCLLLIVRPSIVRGRWRASDGASG